MKYVHWLKIDGYKNNERMAREFSSIENYLKSYPKSKALLYQYDSGSFNWIVRLECEHDYDNLTLYVRRLSRKPKNIGREHQFEFPELYRQYLPCCCKGIE